MPAPDPPDPKVSAEYAHEARYRHERRVRCLHRYHPGDADTAGPHDGGGDFSRCQLWNCEGEVLAGCVQSKLCTQGPRAGRGTGALPFVFNVDLAYCVGVDSQFGSRGDQFVPAEVARLGKAWRSAARCSRRSNSGLVRFRVDVRVVTETNTIVGSLRRAARGEHLEALPGCFYKLFIPVLCRVLCLPRALLLNDMQGTSGDLEKQGVSGFGPSFFSV